MVIFADAAACALSVSSCVSRSCAISFSCASRSAAVSSAAADPASPVGFTGWLGLSPGTLHLLAALAAVGMNTWTHVVEYVALDENARLIGQVMDEVKQIRTERGLDA